MPITAEKKQLLTEALKNLTDVERVLIAGAVYDSFMTADLPWADLNIIYQSIAASVSWSQLGMMTPQFAEQFAKIKVMIVRGIDEVLLKKIPDLLQKQTPEVRQLMADVIKDVDGLELVKIAAAAYNGFVDAGLSQDKARAFSKYAFAKVEWNRLPASLGNEQVKIVWGVRDKLIDLLPDIIQTIVDAPAQEPEQPPTTSTSEAITSQSTITFQVPPFSVEAPVTITSSPPITPTTRSQIDDLDEEASMHGMDTESPPEGGVVPDNEIKANAADDDSASVEEEPVAMEGEEEDEGEEDEDDEQPDVQLSPPEADAQAPATPEDAPSPETNGHNTDVVPPASEDPTIPDATVTTP